MDVSALQTRLIELKNSSEDELARSESKLARKRVTLNKLWQEKMNLERRLKSLEQISRELSSSGDENGPGSARNDKNVDYDNDNDDDDKEDDYDDE